METVVEEKLGERKDDMISLSTVSTTVSKRGQGYGSSLVKVVTGKLLSCAHF